MARQHSAVAAAQSVDSDSEASFDRAQRAATRRFVMRPLSASATNDEVNRQLRESIEIGEMFQRVRRDAAAANGRGWTWHLLQVLDWTGNDVEVNERLFRRSLWEHEGRSASQVAKEQREADEARRARAVRLQGLQDAFDHARPDLQWGAVQNVTDGARCAVLADLESQLSQFQGLLHEVIAAHAAHERLVAELDGLHGRNRRVAHVKGAALVALAELHGLSEESAWKARVADLVVAKNTALKSDPGARVHAQTRRRSRSARDGAPCPTFAKHDEIREKIRKLLNDCRV